jgi:hypothetical protein
MNMQSFFIALNLVAYAQSKPGQSLSVEALTPDVLNQLPIPKLAGFGASPKMAVSSSTHQVSKIGSDLIQLPKQPVSPWTISRTDRVKYEQFFSSFGTHEVPGVQARGLFLKSGLAPDMVNKVFSMCDLDRNGSLDRDEFCIAMQLVVNATKRGVVVPPSLPMTLVPPAKRHHLVSNNTVLSPTKPVVVETKSMSSNSIDGSSGSSNSSTLSASMNSSSSGNSLMMGGATTTTPTPTTRIPQQQQPIISNGVTQSLYDGVASNAALQTEMNKSLSVSRNNLTQVSGHLLDDMRQRLEQVKLHAAAQKVAMSRANEALQQEHLVMQNLMKEIMEEQAKLKTSTEETERIRAQLNAVRNQIEETRSKKHESFKQHAESHVEMLQLTKELKRANYELQEIESEIEQQTKDQSDLSSAKTISEAARTLMKMIEDVQIKQKVAREKLATLKRGNTSIIRSLSHVSGGTAQDKLSSARKEYVDAKKSAENVDMTMGSDTIDAFGDFNTQEKEAPPPRIPSKKEILVVEPKMEDSFEAFDDVTTTETSKMDDFEDFDGGDDAAFDAFPSTTEEGDGFDAYPTEDGEKKMKKKTAAGPEEEKKEEKTDISPPKPPKATKPKVTASPVVTKRSAPPPVPEKEKEEDDFNAFDEFPEDDDGGFDEFPMETTATTSNKDEKKVETTPKNTETTTKYVAKTDPKDDTNAFSTEGFEDWDDLDSPVPSGDAGWADFS